MLDQILKRLYNIEFNVGMRAIKNAAMARNFTWLKNHKFDN